MTSRIRVLWVVLSEPQEKFPVSRRSARNFLAPPRQRTVRTATLEESLVLAGWRPSSYLFAKGRRESWRWGGEERRLAPCGA